MHKSFRPLVAFGVAFALSGCDMLLGPEQQGRAAGLSGSEDFVEYVVDARREMREGNLDQAGIWLDEARALEPDNPAVWVDIARLRYRKGEHLQALDAAVAATEYGPQYAPALLLRAQMVRDAHGMQDALPWYEAAVAADPQNTEVLADYAATLGDGGWHQEMLAAVRRLAEVDPTEPKVHYLQAVLAARGGQTVLARALLERSGMADRGVPAAVLLDALLDMEQGTVETAAQKLEDLAERQPGNERVLELLARALWLSGRDEEIVGRFDQRVRSQDASPYLVMLVARSYERLGQREAAVPLLERALTPRNGELVVLGATSQGRAELPKATRQLRDAIRNGNSAQAIGFARQLRSEFPGSADVHSLLGDVEQARSRHEWAFELYETAATIRKPWPLTKRLYAASYALGDQQAADTLLVRHLEGEPNNAEAVLVLAIRSAERGDWLRVSVLLDYAIALGAGGDPELLLLRAKAAEQLGDDEASERFVEQARVLRPAPFVPRG